MTRDQDLERQLADWLAAGPVVAPPAVVERALEQSEGRRQRHRLWRWLGWLPARPEYGAQAWSRLAVLTAVLATALLVSVSVSVPLLGPGPAPDMELDRVLVPTGLVRIIDETESPTGLSRTVELESEDQRIDGRAEQELDLSFEAADMYHYHGTMRLQNAWGAWEGPVHISGYPTGEEVEMAVLAGTGAYAGFTYSYGIRSQPAGTERTVDSAIWPDEPLSMPDPSSLP